MQTTIRRAATADIVELVQLCEEHACFEGSTTCGTVLLPRLKHALFVEPVRAFAWVASAIDDLSILGYAAASREFATWHGEDFLHLDCLYLKPEARRLGLGRQLLESVRSFAEANNLGWIEWQTPSWNVDAILFYKRFGATSMTKERFSFRLAI
jgi:ribosomal protein S18 acetylase RimI-like enzyme